MAPQIDPAHIGEVDLLSPELVANWRSYATQWSTQAPFHVFLMGFPMLVVGRPDEVREVLLDRDRFSAAPPFEVGHRVKRTAARQRDATSVGVLAMNLAAHPDQFAILRAEPGLVSNAVEESLRVHPAGLFGFPRYSLADGEVGGVPVFPGLPIQVSLAPANYDPVRYPERQAFDCRRGPKGTLSFSTGAHVRLGARLARAILHGAGVFVPQYGGVLDELRSAAIPLVAQ